MHLVSFDRPLHCGGGVTGAVTADVGAFVVPAVVAAVVGSVDDCVVARVVGAVVTGGLTVGAPLSLEQGQDEAERMLGFAPSTDLTSAVKSTLESPNIAWSLNPTLQTFPPICSAESTGWACCNQMISRSNWISK